MRTDDHLYLPAHYRTNPEASSDAGGNPFWADGGATQDLRYQDPVYRWAARLVRDRGWRSVVDVGCGTAHKLAARLGPTGATLVGVDQPSATTVGERHYPRIRFVTGDFTDPALWSTVSDVEPELVMSVDVIEHLVDPRGLLRNLHGLVAHGSGHVLMSTPDRSRLGGSDAIGPPTNPRHIREWSSAELAALVASEGFEVLEQRLLLPRAYSPTLTEARRFLGRVRHRLPVPGARSCQALLLRPTA